MGNMHNSINTAAAHVYKPGDKVIYSGPDTHEHGERTVARMSDFTAGRVWLYRKNHADRQFSTDIRNVRPAPEQRKFQKGDLVLVERKVDGPSTDFANAWVRDMDACVGHRGTVTAVSMYGVSLTGTRYAFPPAALRLIRAAGEPASDTQPTPAVDFAKPLMTRCGYPAVRVLDTVHVDKEGRECFVAMVQKPGRRQPHTYYKDGNYLQGAPHDLDLQNVPEKPKVVERFANVYKMNREAGVDNYRIAVCGGEREARAYLTWSTAPKVATLKLSFIGDALVKVDVVADKDGKDVQPLAA